MLVHGIARLCLKTRSADIGMGGYEVHPTLVSGRVYPLLSAGGWMFAVSFWGDGMTVPG